MQMSLSRVLAAGVAAAGVFSAAYAQEVKEITGAGASFPAPLYSKWAADYYKATGVKVNYQSVGSGADSNRSRPRPWLLARPTCP